MGVLAAQVAPRAFRPVAALAGRAMGARMRVDPADMVRTLRAEDAFDVTARLGTVTAPTLVMGGERDPLYSPDIFRQTAKEIPEGALALYPRGGHLAAMSGPATNLAAGFLLAFARRRS